MLGMCQTPCYTLSQCKYIPELLALKVNQRKTDM